MRIESSAKQPNLTLTEAALEHFRQLIDKEEISDMGLRIFVEYPGSMKADVSIAFCPPGEHRATDIAMEFDVFTLFIEKTSVPFLEQAEIDFKKEGLGGQLSITAPNLKSRSSQEGDTLAERVSFILEAEINPSLASHGGVVTLIEVTANNEVVLRFGGGCHGCGMVDVTLKQGIEKSLMSQIPEITAVLDATDHSCGENPYYT